MVADELSVARLRALSSRLDGVCDCVVPVDRLGLDWKSSSVKPTLLGTASTNMPAKRSQRCEMNPTVFDTTDLAASSWRREALVACTPHATRTEVKVHKDLSAKVREALNLCWRNYSSDHGFE